MINMPQGNQSQFKSTNESVERYIIIGEDFKWDYDETIGKDIKVTNGNRILGEYKDIKSVKSGLRWVRNNYYLSIKIIKVKITIEEIEEVIL